MAEQHTKQTTLALSIQLKVTQSKEPPQKENKPGATHSSPAKRSPQTTIDKKTHTVSSHATKAHAHIKDVQ